MTHPQRIDDERAAAALADLLNGGARRRPVVVVTTPAGRTEPWIDAGEIATQVSDLADIFVIPTGASTWEFSRRMADGTQVYGGAGRVYPVGHEWTTDLAKSPLRFAFDATDGTRVTQQLISDALRMASASGLLQTLPARERRPVEGVVKMVVAGRALVDLGDPLPATIAEELTIEDVPIERILATGQRIAGEYDVTTNRISVVAALRPASDALASYAVGDVVLTRVAMVRGGKAELVLFPKTREPAVVVAVLRADVTANPADDLRTLMTVGEVVPARVVATGPRWALVLHDIDDDEPIVAAPSLLPGGPPWLVEDADASGADDQPSAPAALPRPTALPAPAPPPASSFVQAKPAGAPPAPAPVPIRPSPAMFDKARGRRPAGPPSPVAPPASVPPPSAPPRPVPGPPRSASVREPRPTAQAPSPAAPQPTASAQGPLLTIDALAAQVAALTRGQAELETQLAAGADERAQLRYLLGEAERRANRAEHDLKAARSRLRKAGTRSVSAPVARPVFANREQGFRHLVLTQWAIRTPPNEQPTRPLPDYAMGPKFLDSLDKLQGIKPEKVADVVFEVVTGLAAKLPSRELHRLRTGTGGDDPIRERASDGAVAWRASLQVNTPSARRLHYWVLRGGQIELARVATHDDYDA